jgi:hypothetical protein
MEQQRHQPRRLQTQKPIRTRNAMIHGGNQTDQSWSISGTFSSSDPSDYSNLYNGNDAYPKFVDIGIDQDPQRSQQSDDIIMATTILPIVAAVAFMLCCCMGYSRATGSESHRGRLIREQARRLLEIRYRKVKRQEATPEERLAAIRSGVCTFRVFRKDPSTGRCELGEAEIELPSWEEEKTEATIMATGIESKKSTDTADTLPLDFDNDSNSGGSRDEGLTESDKDDDDDDDGVCPVCLEGFGSGDTVMFARSLSCNHVFHEECLLPWLLEHRESECPSCRAILVRDDENENESNRDDGDSGSTNDNTIICDLPKDGEGENGAREDGLIDLERGTPSMEVTRELETVTYFIDMGRIVAISRNEIETEIERETAKERISFHWPTTGTNGSRDAITARTSRSSQDPQLLPIPRALSESSMDESPLFCHDLRTRDENESDLSIPLPLCRVSQSFPINPRRSQPCDRFRTMPVALCGNRIIDATASSSPNLQIYQDDRGNQYLKLLPLVMDGQTSAMHDGFHDSSSGGDDSDEDDVIRRMVPNHHLRSDTLNTVASSARPSNISSIFVQSQL